MDVFITIDLKKFIYTLISVATLQALHKHYPTLQRKRVLDSISNIMINRNMIFTYYSPYATLATLQRFCD